MNYLQAVQGQLNPPDAISAIQSQADTELGRNLSGEEKTFLLTKFHPNILLGEIQKVIYFMFILHLIHNFDLVWVWILEVPAVIEADAKTFL